MKYRDDTGQPIALLLRTKQNSVWCHRGGQGRMGSKSSVLDRSPTLGRLGRARTIVPGAMGYGYCDHTEICVWL